MNFLPAAYYRGGTSKGVFFNKADLPPGPKLEQILLNILGSPDPYGRQLNGMGGGMSSVSKVVFVEPASEPSIDLIYTFAQVSVDKAAVEYTGNCGNLTSAVVPFGLHTKLIKSSDGRQTFHLLNTNTQKVIAVTLDVSEGQFNPNGLTQIAGVTGSGSKIDLKFLNPGGAVTRNLLPTSSVVESIKTRKQTYEASLVEATSPVVFIDGRSLGLETVIGPENIEQQPELMNEVESIRRLAAVRMGMAKDIQNVPMVNPKIALAFPPTIIHAISGEIYDDTSHNIAMIMFSMGKVHRAITLTGSMCLAAATATAGTIPNQLAQIDTTEASPLKIGHLSGVSTAYAHKTGSGIQSTTIERTARLLMDGRVYF